ncbi:hypothetical protein [Streptococcus thoraltensis]|uniref:hypothetical protein n=1 Tax=Streptococcus thoraltensis TaxID=55085 RepID=UPI00037DA40F|nr:hypothetical protein [Streptococcus thoraltensis]MDY4762430.1 hypothetical protein [Streptococcus thoraltensis]
MKIKIKRGDADADRTVFIKSSQQGLNEILNEYGVKPMQLSDFLQFANRSINNNEND